MSTTRSLALMSVLVLATPFTTGASADQQEQQGNGVVIELGPSSPQGQRRVAPRSRPLRQWRLQDRRAPEREPAAARGYADGYQRGLDDGRDRDRYDPVGHRNYRAGDLGYYRDYGPRVAYRNNYRSGFRQGYEDGYRDGARGRHE